GASKVLTEAFGEKANLIQVQIQDRGRVALSGTIPSYEDKLGVSQKLRKVAGCNCVTNDLQVAELHQGGRVFVRVDAAGRQLLSADTVAALTAEAGARHKGRPPGPGGAQAAAGPAPGQPPPGGPTDHGRGAGRSR